LLKSGGRGEEEKWEIKFCAQIIALLKIVNEKSPINRNNLDFSQMLIFSFNSDKNY